MRVKGARQGIAAATLALGLGLGLGVAPGPLTGMARAEGWTGPLTPAEIETLWPSGGGGEEGSEGANAAGTAGDDEPAATTTESLPEPPPTDQKDLDSRQAAAKALREDVETEIEALLKTPVTAPVPPSLDLRCEEDEVTRLLTEQLVNGWVRQASEPEVGLFIRLQEARRGLQLLGADDGKSYALEARIAGRLAAKAEALMAANKGKDEAVPAVAAFVTSVVKVGALFGRDQSYALLTKLAAWLEPVIPKMTKALRTEHDFAMVQTIIRLIRSLNLLGAETGVASLDSALADIEKAMHFDLTLDFTFSLTGANGNVEAYKLTATIPLDWVLGEVDKQVRAILTGEGTGSYASYTESEGRIQMTAPGFPILAKIEEFDACAGTAKLVLDRFYADEETYIFHDGTSAPLSVALYAWTLMFDAMKNGETWRFDLEVVNRKERPVEMSISQDIGVFAGELAVKLDHKPK